jgi:hypothetical protein
MRAKISQFGASFERLSVREQVMVLFMVLAIAAMIFGVGGFFVNKDLKAREKRIAAKIVKLKEIAALRTDYQKRLAEQQRLVAEVRGNANIRILSYLEDLAKKARVDLVNASERRGESTGSDQVKEEGAEVTVKNVSLDRLHELLRQIEEGNRLVKVRRLRIKSRFDKRDMLDATITVGTFKPAS